jgi:DNA-nicking Smr family endonuclease
MPASRLRDESIRAQRVSMKPRGKIVSAEDEALFRSALNDAKPLKARAKGTAVPAKAPRIRVASPRFAPEPTYNEQPAPAIGGHADAHLRRGRLEPQSRIDLHGMTQERAYRALVAFLVHARAEGQKLVLVITGKGGVLRSQLPLWLGQNELRVLVAGLNEAHVRHGGSGAFYVLLKRQKRSQVDVP